MSELERRVRRWRIERLRSLWVEGSLRLGAGLAAYLLAALALDSAFALPQSARWALFGAGSAGALIGLGLFFIKPLSLLEPAPLLRAASERYPAARAYLRSAWELCRGVSPHTSCELAQEHVARAERLLEELPQEPVFSCRPPKRITRRLGFVAAAWGLGLPWFYRGSNGLERVLLPWRDIRLESLAKVVPGDARVPWGATVTIQARWLPSAATPGRMGLELRSAGQNWQAAPWDMEGETLSFRIDGLTAPLEYRVAYKDLISRAYTLTPVPFPRLTGIKVRLRLPGKVIQQAPLEGSSEVSALRGSWVTLTGRPDQKIASANLDISYLGAPVRMKPLGGLEWEGGFPLNENGTFKIGLVGMDGTRDPNPMAYTLRALDDQPPTVELLSPAFELEISPKERLPVAYSARDDYGLSSVSLVYRVLDQEVEMPVKRFFDLPKDTIGDYSWDLSRLPLGARVEFWLKVQDNAQPPHAAISGKGGLRLVDFDSAHEAAKNKWLVVERSLKDLADREGQASKNMESPVADKRAWAQELERMGQDLSARWAEAEAGAQEFARSMAQDPYANPGMAQAAEAMAQELKFLRDSELPRARAAARAGRYGEAARKHAELEARVREASRFLSDGRELQSMQDFWSEAHRMDQAGSELSRELGEIAERGKAPSAEELGKLQGALSELRKQMDGLARAIESLPKAEQGSPREARRKTYTVPLNAARSTAYYLQQALDRGDYAQAARLARRLSEQLSRMRSTIADAARSSVAEDPEQEAVRRMEQALAVWRDAIENQSRSLQMAQKVEAQGRSALNSAEQDLLKELAGSQAQALRDAAGLGSAMPLDGLSPMRQVLAEFEAGQVRDAPQLLEGIISRLKNSAARYPKPEKEPARGVAALAQREQDIRQRLAQGARAKPPSEAALSDMIAARAMQGQAARKTSELQESLKGLGSAGESMAKAEDSVERARAKQRDAEASLAERDGAAARVSEEKALDLLQEGMKSASDALRQRQSIQQGSAGPFNREPGVARPMGARGRTGADTGFVPLPNVEDYQPPREIRREVEKSLRERRPRAFDETIREYFKGMSQ